MNKNQADNLWELNVKVIEKLDLHVGSVVRAILIALRGNGATYLRLHSPSTNVVKYDFVEGDQEMVDTVCRYYGVKHQNNTITV